MKGTAPNANSGLQFLQFPYINCAGMLQNETSFRAKPHFHEYGTELQFFAHGNAIVYVNGVQYQVRSGDLAIYESNQIHSDDHTCSKSQNLTYFIRFQEYQLSGRKPNMLLPEGSTPVLHTGEYSGEFHFLFDSICSEYEQQMPHSGNLAEHYFKAILYLIHRIQQPGAGMGQSTLAGHAQSTALQVKEYIDDNYYLPIAMKSLETHFSISASHLGRLFHNEVGITPLQYLMRVRIAEAKKLLAKSEYTLSEIAVNTGFQSSAYFSTQFKRIVGITPGEYRQGWRGLDDHRQV